MLPFLSSGSNRMTDTFSSSPGLDKSLLLSVTAHTLENIRHGLRHLHMGMREAVSGLVQDLAGRHETEGSSSH